MPFLLLTVAVAAPPPAPPDWEAMIDATIPAVVTIKVSATRAFDMETASNSTATGFVIDAERGLILTNRHVVEPGPVVAEAVFANHEEVPLKAVYRDPVHDFGLYQYDPATLHYDKVHALELVPSHARVGAEIRVMGSDNAEKLAILGGTVARLDRDAPRYGSNRFNDFNTFYIQAASSTSGGSSGSPVLDAHGHVIALNAGSATKAATSFFLPLDRVVRAVEALRAGRPVTRGTFQVVFDHKTYDEVRRLGLRPETEAEWRRAHPEATGLLVVDEVLPGGPADGRLRPGDVLLTFDDAPIADFVGLESAQDDHVGSTLRVRVERGGAPVEVEVSVQDLHAITPSSYLEFGGGVLNDLSFQLARNKAQRVGGVYVASAGYALGNGGVPVGAVIVAVDGKPVGTLAEAERALAAQPDRAAVPVTWFSVDAPQRHVVSVVRVDRRWFPMQRCERDDTTGRWPCTASPAPPAAPPPTAQAAAVPLASTDRVGRAVGTSLVWVRCSLPFRTDGVYAASFTGTGVVVDAEQGLVLVDRDTVPVTLADVVLTFGGTLQVPATVRAVHPFHNLALVQYDPAALGQTPVHAVQLRERSLSPGDKVWHVGLAGETEIQARATRVSRADPLFVPIPDPPGFRDTNLEVLELEQPARASGGVLADARGRMVSFYASFVDNSGDKPAAAFRGMSAELVEDFLRPILEGGEPTWRALGAELLAVRLPEAMQRGLAPSSVAAVLAAAPDRRELLEVQRRTAGSPAAQVLNDGDLIVALGDRWAPTVADVERAARAPELTLRVLRDGNEVSLTVPTTAADGHGVDRVVVWAGAVVHEVPSWVASQRGVPAAGLYVNWHWYGAPASRYGLLGTSRIVAIDDHEVRTLDELLAATAGRPDRSSVRVRTLALDGREQVVTLKLDLQYWPTMELRRTEAGWVRLPR